MTLQFRHTVQAVQDLDDHSHNRLVKTLSGLATFAVVFTQILQLPAMARIQTDSTNSISSAAYYACRTYQSRNTWVGYLMNGRDLGNNMYGCDFSRVCLRVNGWGQQAHVPVSGLHFAKKLDADAPLKTIT